MNLQHPGALTIDGQYILAKNAIKNVEYKCIDCDKIMILVNGYEGKKGIKKGIKVESYLRHKVDSNCESDIHKHAKYKLCNILNDKKSLNLIIKCNTCKDIENINIVCDEKDKSYIEYCFDNKHRADVCTITNENKLKFIFEVLNTHSTDIRPEPWYEISAHEICNNDNNLFNCVRQDRICIKCISKKSKQEELLKQTKEKKHRELEKHIQSQTLSKRILKQNVSPPPYKIEKSQNRPCIYCNRWFNKDIMTETDAPRNHEYRTIFICENCIDYCPSCGNIMSKEEINKYRQCKECNIYDKIQREKKINTNLFEEMDKPKYKAKYHKSNTYATQTQTQTQPQFSFGKASIPPTVHKIDIIDGQPLITNFFKPKQSKR